MTDIVLVHGAWHGGWCWDRLAESLQPRGYVVHAPTLSGVGERAAEASRLLQMTHHAMEIARCVERLDSDDVVLVGHSYGGLVMRQAAETVAARLRMMVFLEAPLVGDGESTFDSIAPFEAGLRAEAESHGDSWLIPPSPAELFGITDEADVAWVTSRLTSQPLATFETPLALSSPEAAEVPAAHIAGLVGPLSDFARRWSEVGRKRGWPTIGIEGGHDLMITHSDEVAREIDLLIRDYARPPRIASTAS